MPPILKAKYSQHSRKGYLRTMQVPRKPVPFARTELFHLRRLPFLFRLAVHSSTQSVLVPPFQKPKFRCFCTFKNQSASEHKVIAEYVDPDGYEDYKRKRKTVITRHMSKNYFIILFIVNLLSKLIFECQAPYILICLL